MTDMWSALADRLDPQPMTQADAFTLIGYRPEPKQWEFHGATEDEVLYGGAAGGGKTVAMVTHGIWACLAYPGITVAGFRKTFPELRSEVLPVLRKFRLTTAEGAAAVGATWNASTWELTFRNGSLFRLLYCESLDDATRYQSAEWQLLLLFERTLFPPGVCSMLIERLRSGDARVPVLGVRAGSNPGGLSHGEVRGRYIKPTDYGAVVHTDDEGITVRFIPATIDDNSHVDPKYRARLDGIKNPKRRAAMRDGNWDTYAGQAFSEWDHGRHVVEPFRLPQSWQRYCAIDYGYSAPWAVEWVAIDEDGRGWVYAELYEAGVGEADQARRILTAEATRQCQGIDESGKLRNDMPEPQPVRRADPAMWAKRGDAQSIAKVYGRNGVALQPANNDRLSGKARLHRYLADGPACAHHRAQGWETCPRLHIFANCRHLIDELPDLPLDPNRPEDVDTHAADHAYDALRYALMAVGTGATWLETDDAPDDAVAPIHEDYGEFAAMPGALRPPVASDADDWDW